MWAFAEIYSTSFHEVHLTYRDPLILSSQPNSELNKVKRMASGTNHLASLKIFFINFFLTSMWFLFRKLFNTRIQPAGTACTHLLHFGCCAPEELNVSFTQQVLVLPQGVLSVFLTCEEHKGISRWPTIRIGDEEDAFLSPGDGAMLSKEGDHLLSGGGEREPPHADDDLIFLGEELGYLIGCP